MDELAGTRINSIGGIIIVHRAKSEGNAHTTTVEQVYNTIIEKPGITAREIREIVNIGNGTTYHHLHALEKNEKIASHICGRHRRFWTANFNNLKQTMYLTEVCLHIVDMLREKREGFWVKDIVQRLGTSHPRVCYNLRKLEIGGMIVRKKEGRMTRCILLEV